MKFRKQTTFILAFAMTLILSLSACSSSGTQPGGAAPTPSGGTSAPTEPQASGNNAPVEPIVLKFSYPQAEASYYGKTYNFFAEKVFELTDGTVKIETYPSATLVADSEILDAVMLGNVDMGHFYTTNLSPTIRDFTPLEIPGAYPAEDYYTLKNATFDLVDSIFDDYGIKFIALSYPDTIGIAMTDRIIHGAKDMAGKTIRSGGTFVSKAFALWGGSAATIPIGDVASALERGTVGGVFTGWMMLQSFKFDETAPYVTFTGFQNGYYGIMMNKNVWNKLNADQQKALLEAGNAFGDFSDEVYNGNKEHYLKKLTDEGAEYYFLTDDENKALRDVSLTLMNEVKGIVGEKGLQLVDALAKLRGE